ncbi:fungal-specific transcription factor domain-containing protein [Aspergillus floccosus]
MVRARTKCKLACKSCNLRRVKCDRTEQGPCSNCQLAGQDCQPIVSRRGKYPRTGAQRTESRPALRRSQRQQDNERSQDSALSEESYQGTITGESGNSADNNATSGELSSRQNSQRPTSCSDGKVTYYGDSSNLEYMLHEMGDPLSAMSNGLTLEGTIEHLYFRQLGRATKSLLEEHRRKEGLWLKGNGAFETFERTVSQDLIRTFFESCHSQIPIFDRGDFQLKYEAGRISLLVLHAVYFVAMAHCSETLYERAGFTDRYSATFACYQKAKALYDANYESDAIATLQAVCLLSYWWGSPLEQKDMWHWLGVASNLAQSLGLHQRKTYSGLNEGNKRLWKRLWWNVYIHDISAALVLGRTPHINDAYCSVNMLNDNDFDSDDDEVNADLFGNPSCDSRLYVVYSAQLYLHTSKCMLEIHRAECDESAVTKSLDDLTSWKDSLPVELQLRQTMISTNNGPWASLIHLSYFTAQILLRRSSPKHHNGMKAGTVAFDAAVQIVRILEDLVSLQLLNCALPRSSAAALAALSVQIANMRGCAAHIVEVSKHRARLCMFVMNKMKDHAPPLAWYYRLFVRLLNSLGCQIPGEETQELAQNQRSHGLPLSAAEFSYNIQPGHGCSQEAEPNNSAFGALFNDPLFNDPLFDDPALGDFTLPEMLPSFAFSGLLNSDPIDEASADMESYNLNTSSI